MIAQIYGTLIEKLPPEIVIDVQGLGYEVHVSMHTFYRLPEIGEKIKLHTHFVVREDAQLLYGFFDKDERSMFRTLIKVNGVGPKLALTILSSVTPTEFTQFVLDNNSAALVKLPGVGKKTADRLLVEIRDKLKDSPNAIGKINQESFALTSSGTMPEQEAISALIALGYKPQEASRAIARIEIAELSSKEIIRKALQSMGQGK